MNICIAEKVNLHTMKKIVSRIAGAHGAPFATAMHRTIQGQTLWSVC